MCVASCAHVTSCALVMSPSHCPSTVANARICHVETAVGGLASRRLATDSCDPECAMSTDSECSVCRHPVCAAPCRLTCSLRNCLSLALQPVLGWLRMHLASRQPVLGYTRKRISNKMLGTLVSIESVSVYLSACAPEFVDCTSTSVEPLMPATACVTCQRVSSCARAPASATCDRWKSR